MTQQETVNILLIEDDLSDAEMIIRALKKKNLDRELFHVEDGAAAIDYILGEGIYTNAGVRLPKLIILDLHMPKINGLDVLQTIRTDPRLKRIPIVVLTSSREDSDLKKCYDLGVNSYIVKPVEFSLFTKTIEDLGHYWLQVNQNSN